MLSGLDPYLFSRNMDPAFFFIYPAVNQCCGAGAGAGGAEIIWGAGAVISYFNNYFSLLSSVWTLEDVRINKN